MGQITQSNIRKPLMCKYCKLVEITFSKSKLSKTGKPIPLNANSLEPHSCSQNPYNLQQAQSEVKEPDVKDLLYEIIQKLDKLIDEEKKY